MLLFGLLLSSGAGSYFAGRRAPRAPLVLGIAALLTAVIALGMPPVVSLLEGASTPVRIAAALAFIAPLGVLMGMAFPLGVGAAERSAPGLLPWLWGLNGAASVLASVMAVVIALELGIGANLWIGVACYLAAAAAAAVAVRRELPAAA